MEVFHYYPWLFPVMAAIFGLVIGSFLNVVIYRLPKMMENEWRQECAESFPEYKIESPKEKLTLSVPRSSCQSCKTPIRVRDNIPVLSWLLLKGKCHACDDSIKVRYPLIELLTAGLSFAVAWQFGFSYFSVALLFFTFVLIAATFIDLDTLLLPDQLTLPLMWAGIALSLFEISPISLTDAIIGAMVGYLCLWSVYQLFKLATGKEGMGYGDFKLLAALGAWLGWQSLPIIILMSSLVGVVFGVIQLRLQKKGIEQAFPFGPYLAIAGWITLMFGQDITNWYFSHFLGI
ncbi:Type 4 prepilin-like proteins leader peptide-processing enzyme (Includes: Leader peptidase; N-methyltransferase) [Vibrio nigripulchritudo SO65]|uniref:prepilin peptidase n=1 Tax=Vibrio nigripulchritudo TaxID=28173 RepID=UPI0003B1A2CE|nr:A24 family peptidase [Vibrio nigripulchritudo]CCN35528.1 Type 4 prepilin-like proteins leader peptide-processing enzyme (Includes: Leader peptidase; N-methyltransferase) [Vibrio nigripulchritudo AM115]CCN40885.1 Type 4 prepilin-like proteins leader peptide-processing enzyme (Includes: Leader peptidase; N-methyltransferase) [Vibrio nigripulchritudo FTn2]CCN67398.1 Type 4 prepilin-like proteins leader peptide-processing enzyme (Includes: Leader peptidase; N-methyltransferase) [Vibrio nigripulch